MNFKLMKIRDVAKGKPIQSQADVISYIRDNMEEESMADRECFWVLHLNARNQVIEKELTAMGCINSCIVRPADVLRKAVLNGTVAIIAVHNHPSGNTEPSQEDVQITDKLRKSCEFLGIVFLDSVIMAAHKIGITER